jgi:hypothetical protein
VSFKFEYSGEKGVTTAAAPKALNVLYQDGAETMTDVGQAARRSRGWPRKAEVAGMKDSEEAISPGPSKGSVTDKGTRV